MHVHRAGRLAACLLLLIILGCEDRPTPETSRKAAELYDQARCDEALPLLLRIARHEPAEAAHWERVAGCYALAGDYEGGRRLFEDVATSPDTAAPQRLHLGYFQWKTARYTAAIWSLRAVLAEEPGNARARLWLVRCLGSAGRFEERLELAEAIVNGRTDDALLWIEVALARLDAGRPSGAEHALTRAIATDPELASAWRYRGALSLKSGNLDGTLPDLEQAVELDDRDPDNLYQLANVLYRLGQGERADGVMERFEELK